MAIRLSTGCRNGLVGTQGIKELFNGGKINVYTGGQPANADLAETGTLLVTITSSSGTAGITLGTQGSGIIPKDSGLWSGVVAAGGIAGWFRMYGSAGTSGSSASEVRVDGNVGVSGSDMVLSNTTLALNATLTIDTATITQPAS